MTNKSLPFHYSLLSLQGCRVHHPDCGNRRRPFHSSPATTSALQKVLFGIRAIALCAAVLVGLAGKSAIAQQPASPLPDNNSGWIPAIQNQFNTTVVPRSPSLQPKPLTQRSKSVELQAFLTDTGQQIAHGLVWRIHRIGSGIDDHPKLLSTHRAPSPKLNLAAGVYIVNASLGRANLSRKITVKPGNMTIERFVLNAGGLRVMATLANGKPIPAGAISYEIYSDERNQFGNRTRIVGAMKPGVVIRLNAGIYHIVSTYGDANALVRSDVTVEAGKLTIAQVAHLAARITLKLVTRPGGDALADTKWSLATPKGLVIKESVGAIPSHIIAAGNYIVSAHHGNRIYQSSFSVAPDEDAQIEVVMQ